MMVTLRRVQRAIDFVESHLDEPFSLDDVAASVGLSRYHLHRVFFAVLGDSLKGYIRKRRLTEAAVALRTTDRRILELALVAGFGSQEAFTRAFRALFGVPPGRYRADTSARGRPGLFAANTARLAHRYAGIEHEPRIVERTRPLTVTGYGIAVDFEDDGPIGALWRDMLATWRARHPGHPDDRVTLFGVTQPNHPAIPQKPEQCLAYVAAVRSKPDHATPDTAPEHEWREALAPRPQVDVTIEPGRYAVFEHRGPLVRLPDTVNYAWASWLCRCPFGKSARPDFEHIPLDQLGAAQPRVQLWLSIDDPGKGSD